MEYNTYRTLTFTCYINCNYFMASNWQETCFIKSAVLQHATRDKYPHTVKINVIHPILSIINSHIFIQPATKSTTVQIHTMPILQQAAFCKWFAHKKILITYISSCTLHRTLIGRKRIKNYTMTSVLMWDTAIGYLWGYKYLISKRRGTTTVWQGKLYQVPYIFVLSWDLLEVVLYVLILALY